MKINFSPPDITDLEINEVIEALKVGGLQLVLVLKS